MKQSTLCGHGASAQTKTSGTTNLKYNFELKFRLFRVKIRPFRGKSRPFRVESRPFESKIRLGLN